MPRVKGSRGGEEPPRRYRWGPRSPSWRARRRAEHGGARESKRSGGTMAELRVPTLTLPAAVLDADGYRTAGQVFLPAQAFAHTGATRPEEWINGPGNFFPFLPEGAQRPVVLNKS